MVEDENPNTDPTIDQKMAPIFRLLGTIGSDEIPLVYQPSLGRACQNLGISKTQFTEKMSHPTEYKDVVEEHYRELLSSIKQRYFEQDTPEDKAARISRFLESPRAAIPGVPEYRNDGYLMRAAMADASDFVVDSSLVPPCGLDDPGYEPILHHNVAASVFTELQEKQYKRIKTTRGLRVAEDWLIERPANSTPNNGPA